MKIAKIEQFFPRRRMRLIKITTDTGIVGWGETTLEGKPKSTWAAVEELADYLIGKDPLRIEHHWQHIYRSAFYRGGNVLMTALSGIDQALWDIAGKYFDVPTYQLLGGPVRDRIRVYAHWGIRDSSERGLDVARERLEMLQEKGGYKAFKSGPGGKWRAHEPPAVIDRFVKCAYTMREWVGDDCELCFDFHGKMTPALAVEICHEIKGMRPMFVEEPVPQENVDALKHVSDHVPFPIATGERLLSRWEFRTVLKKMPLPISSPTARMQAVFPSSSALRTWRKCIICTLCRTVLLGQSRSRHVCRSMPLCPIFSFKSKSMRVWVRICCKTPGL